MKRYRLSDELAGLLGDCLLTDPRGASRLLSRRQFHELMEISGGSVQVQRRDWTVTGEKAFAGYIRVTLREG